MAKMPHLESRAAAAPVIVCRGSCGEALVPGTAAAAMGICVWCSYENQLRRATRSIRSPRYGTSAESQDDR